MSNEQKTMKRINQRNLKLFIGALLLVLIHLFLLVQLRFTVWPEMMVIPYLMHRGFELYRDMIVPWTPGLMWILDGWFWLVGLSPDRLKLLTWILVAIIDVLIFRIASKRYGIRSGLLALTLFLFLHPLYDGNGLWFDLAAVPLLLFAFYKKNPLFLGPAFLIKQSVVWVFPLSVIPRLSVMSSRSNDLTQNLTQSFRTRSGIYIDPSSSAGMTRITYLILGLVVAIGGSFIWFWSRGTLNDYFYWAYDFTFRVFPTIPGHADLTTWRHWAFALFPFALIFSLKSLKSRNIRWIIDSKDPAAWSFFLLPFALPRFGLFHFQPSITFLSLSIAFFLTGPDFSKEKSAGTPEPRSRALRQHGRRPWAEVSILLGLALFLSFSWLRLLSQSWHRPDRFLEPDVYQFAARVALETNPDEPVLLVNGPELAYVLANRLPPKPWFTQFPWFLELPGFQERVIKSFKDQRLRQVIFTPYLHEGEYVPGSYQPKKLLEYVQSLNFNYLNN